MNRRNFHKMSLLNLLALPFLGMALDLKPKRKLKNVLVHHVYFWLKNPDSKEDLEKLLEGLDGLSKVEEIKTFHIGKPAATRREVIDSSYAVSWFTMFESAKDQDIYQVHPIHLDFVKNYSHLWSKVIVYDSVDAHS